MCPFCWDRHQKPLQIKGFLQFRFVLLVIFVLFGVAVPYQQNQCFTEEYRTLPTARKQHGASCFVLSGTF